jgi:hypothetical protein
MQCHLAYRSINALTCMFAPDGQSDPPRRPGRICAGQNHKDGQAILEDQFRLSGIASGCPLLTRLLMAGGLVARRPMKASQGSRSRLLFNHLKRHVGRF